MKILITGGAGFVGHHFVEFLLNQRDCEVTVVDRASGKFGITRLKEIDALSNPRIKFYRQDFGKEDILNAQRINSEIDYIFHIGAKIASNEKDENSNNFINSNVVGTQQILELAIKQNNLKLFIYISTSEIFGPSKGNRLFKEWDPYNSQNIYAATKASGEELVLAYSIQHQIPSLIIHTMNLFGERQQPEKFIPSIVRNLINNQPIPVYRHEGIIGTRTYLDVKELVYAIQFIINNSEYHQKRFIRQKINIAGTEILNNNELVEKIAGILGLPPLIEWREYYSVNPGHILHTALDTTQLSNLGWHQKQNLDTSLRRTVEWLIDNPSWLDIPV
jgi:dTDP-glucose 4,6-dehydratase